MEKEKVIRFTTAAEAEADLMLAYSKMTTAERWAMAYSLACQYHKTNPSVNTEGRDSKKVYKSAVPFD